MNKTTIGKINATSAIIAEFLFWLNLIPMAMLFAEIEIGFYIFVAIWILIAILWLTHALLAFFVRCPFCAKCLTIGTRNVHENAREFRRYNGWYAVVTEWFTGSVVCIHCGNTC